MSECELVGCNHELNYSYLSSSISGPKISTHKFSN